ncbi:MAG TPA: PAS domain-containing protein, partial [Rubricoccaceae bacterium]
MPDPSSAPRLAARIEAAEAALQHAALGRPDALALLETAVAHLCEALRASVGAAFVAAGETGYVRCAVCSDAAPPDLVDLDPALWPAVIAGQSVLVGPGSRSADALLAGLGAEHALLLPIRGAAPGVIALGRHKAFTEAESVAGVRLAALFSTLWAWTDAEARFQRTVADLDDALFTFGHDPNGRRTYAVVTPQVEAITGLASDAILAGTADWAALVHADDQAAFAAHDARLQAGEASRISVRLVRPSGETVWVSERATPSVDAAGRPVAGGLLSDVTAQKEAEAT